MNKKFKISITGHTNGLGKFYYDTLLKEHTVTGYSRTNGYNIGLAKDRNLLCEAIYEDDIFINNAYHKFSQTELLYELYSKWQHLPKMIINIGSNAKDFVSAHSPHPYSVHKLALNAASKQLSRVGTCKVISLDFGFLNREDTTKTSIGYDAAYEYLQMVINTFDKPHKMLEVLVSHNSYE